MSGPSRSVLIIGLVFIVVAGLSALAISKRGSGDQSNDVDNLDPLIKELTSTPSSGLPDYALTSKKTEAAYRISVEFPDLIEKFPCYCGCRSIRHKSLKDCFTKGDEGGFGEHASFCDLCVDEALDVYKWQKEGVPLKEARSRFDEKYTRYGEPTDTPLI